eukprot:351996-Chlamydomonas_euryale.AAC.6
MTTYATCTPSLPLLDLGLLHLTGARWRADAASARHPESVDTPGWWRVCTGVRRTARLCALRGSIQTHVPAPSDDHPRCIRLSRVFGSP